MGADQQSTEIEINGAKAYLNLWKQREDSELFPGPGIMPKGTWHLMSTYPPSNTLQQWKWISEKIRPVIAVPGYPTEQDAKDAVALLVRNLEANWDGWGDGHSGMPGFYSGPVRRRP